MSLLVLDERGAQLFAVDADPERGHVIVANANGAQRITVGQSAHLRALLERAEQVVSTGIGDMKERP